ncbi:MAG: S8 family serine peptidase [Calditrichia bacterium]
MSQNLRTRWAHHPMAIAFWRSVQCLRRVQGVDLPRGPSADGRIKPDVCARGVKNCLRQRIRGQTGYAAVNGTSLSCPLVAVWLRSFWRRIRD